MPACGMHSRPNLAKKASAFCKRTNHLSFYLLQPPQAMYGMQMPGSVPFIQTVPTMQTMPSSTAQSSGEMSLLMSESKIHHGEIKSAVNRVTERIDDLMLKVSNISFCK